MDCFCGCGQNVPFKLRSSNRAGKDLQGHIDDLSAVLADGVRSPNAERVLEVMEDCRDSLKTAVHEQDYNGDALGRSAAIRTGWPLLFGPKAFDRAMHNAGLSEEEAITRFRSGDWDPFSDELLKQQPTGEKGFQAMLSRD